MSLQSDMRTFDNIYLKFRNHHVSSLYPTAITKISDQAAIYRSVQHARGVGGMLAAIATKPDTLDRDLATLRVENAAEQNQCRLRTENALKELGVPEALIAALQPELDRLVGPWLPGEKRASGQER